MKGSILIISDVIIEVMFNKTLSSIYSLKNRLFCIISALQVLLNRLHHLILMDIDKGQHTALVITTGCPSCAMNIRIHVQWEVKVDDIRQTLEVNASRHSRLLIRLAFPGPLSILLLQRFLLLRVQCHLIRCDDDIICAHVELLDDTTTDLGRQLRVQDARLNIELFQKQFQSEDNRIDNWLIKCAFHNHKKQNVENVQGED